MYINHKTVACQYFLNSFLLLFYVIPHNAPIKGLSGRNISLFFLFSFSDQFYKSNGFWYACACRWLRRLYISHGGAHFKLAVVVISGDIKGRVNLVSSIILEGCPDINRRIL